MSSQLKPIKKAAAIAYSADLHEAPILSAKGKGHVAEAIIEKAKQSGVPILEDKSLVELLSAIELNEQIPPELYQVVAEILAFVYQMDQKAGRK